MQIPTQQLIIWIFCITCCILQIILTVFHQKLQKKISFKQYSILFWGNLFLIAFGMVFLFSIVQTREVILFEIVAIVFIQIDLGIYVTKIWQKEVNSLLFFGSLILFGSLRIVGDFVFYREILGEILLTNLAPFPAIIYELSLILCITLFFFFILCGLMKLFLNTSLYNSIFKIIWFCLFIFALTPYIDLLISNLGIKSFFEFFTWPIIGYTVAISTIGTIIQFTFLIIIIILAVIILGRKYGFVFLENTNSNLSHPILRTIGMGALIFVTGGIIFVFVVLIHFTIPISILLNLYFEYPSIFYTQTYFLVTVICLILLLIPFYCTYLISNVIKYRNNLWEYPNSFNTTPFLNLIPLVFSGFIICYYELVPPDVIFYLNRSFILSVAYFYLIIFIIFLVLYFLSIKKQSWLDLSYSIKKYVIFVPFILGFLFAGLILKDTEILLGLMACSGLQLFATFLHKIKKNEIKGVSNRLYSLNSLFWAVLAISFAGLISKFSLFCTFVCILLILIVELYLKESQYEKTTFNWILLGTIFLIGACSKTFRWDPSGLGIPNNYILFSYFLFLFFTIVYYYLLRRLRT